MLTLFYIMSGFFLLVLATFWIWVPILIIVLVRRSNKKKEVALQEEQARQQWLVRSQAEHRMNGMQVKRKVDGTVEFGDTKEFKSFEQKELNEKLYAELRKSKPSIVKMREILKEIEEGATKREVSQNEMAQAGMYGEGGGYSAPAPTGFDAGMPAYNYGYGPNYGYNATQVPNMAPNNYAQAAAQTNYEQVVVQPRNEHAGLNAILYVGSLLVVAGVGALIASMLPDGMKMMIMLLIVVIFYAGGLLVRRDERLLVAGKAFVGTALAIIPFLGPAAAGFLQIPGEIAWLWTNILGLIAYVVATIALESKVIAYLSMGFLLSLALSMSATLALPMMWYFIFVMVVGVAAAVVRIVAPNKVPALFSEVIDVTGKWLTLLTLVASIFVLGVADIRMYVWLLWIASAQMGLVWWDKKILSNELMFRGIVHVALLVTSLDIFDGDLAVFGIAFGVIAALQLILSMMLGVVGKKLQRESGEWTMTVLMMFAMVGSCLIVLSGGEPKMASVVCLVAMAFVGVASGISAAIYSRVGWLYGVLIAMVSLPPILGSWVLTGEAQWGLEMYFSVYFVQMALAIALRALVRKNGGQYDVLGVVAMVVFGAIGVGCSLGLGAGYQILGLGLVAAGFGGYGLIIKNMTISEVGAYVGGVMIWRAIGAIEVLDAWMVGMLGFWVMSLVFGATSWWRERDKGLAQRARMGGVLTLVIFGVMATWAGHDSVWQILSMVVATGVWIGYGAVADKKGIAEVGVYFAGITLCRMANEVMNAVPKVEMWVYGMVYMYIMALTCGVTSWWREREQALGERVRMGGVLALVIFASMATWFGADALWQILTMVIATGVWVGYGWTAKKDGVVEVGVYFGAVTLCRMISEVVTASRGGGWIYTIVYAHVMALALVGVSIWRERDASSKTRLGLAMGILTSVMGMRALSASTAAEAVSYPLWFLMEQAVFVVAGGLTRRKWMWVWGTCGIGLAVMWFVREMAFVWLMLLGFGLIGLVVWQLLKGGKKKG